MKKRIISAFVALLICIPPVYFGGIYFQILVFVLGLLGFRELLKLFDIPIGMKAISLLSFLVILYTNINNNQFNQLLNTNILAIILLLFCLMTLFYHKTTTTDQMFKLLGSTLFLGICFSLFLVIRNIHLTYFIYLFTITIFTDTFAQAIGTIIGKHKAIPISPNKTWEGYIGGTVIGVLLGVVIFIVLVDPYAEILKICFISLVLSIAGQLGDLFFSQIKRNNSLKDFSNIMPGHGGVIDRFDSIFFAMLAFTFLSNLL